MTNYRQVGGRLGAYIRANNPRTQQIQGLLSDLLADDELLPMMRDVISRPEFQAIYTFSGTGTGAIQRDVLIQELSKTYLPLALHKAEEVLNGMLDLPQKTTLDLTRVQRSNGMRSREEDHRSVSINSYKTKPKSLKKKTCTFSEFAVGFLITSFVWLALAIGELHAEGYPSSQVARLDLAAFPWRFNENLMGWAALSLPITATVSLVGRNKGARTKASFYSCFASFVIVASMFQLIEVLMLQTSPHYSYVGYYLLYFAVIFAPVFWLSSQLAKITARFAGRSRT